MGLGLLATGIGLIFAIASLGDKIKDINKEIREYENTFMDKLGTDWVTLRPLLKSKTNPNEKLNSVAKLIAVDKLEVATLQLFEKLNSLRDKLEHIHSNNYYSFIILAIFIFLSILFDFIVSDEVKFRLLCFCLSKEVVILMINTVICICIVIRLVLTKKREDDYRNLLYEIGDNI